MTAPMYNSKCAGVKRLMKESSELSEPTEMFFAQPMEDNLFEWHFTVRGPMDSDFDGGVYHGKIMFPAEYPMKPPNMIFLTPNGRFAINQKICLTISGHHPETWLPSWSIRTALLALIGFMPSQPGGALGSLDYPPIQRKKLAQQSLNWTCKECGLCMKNVLKPLTDDAKSNIEEAKRLASQLEFKDESEKKTSLAALANVAADPSTSAPSESETASPTTEQSSQPTDQQTRNVAPATVTATEVTRNAHTVRAQAQVSNSSDLNLFVYIPVGIVFFALLVIIFARRFLV